MHIYVYIYIYICTHICAAATTTTTNDTATRMLLRLQLPTRATAPHILQLSLLPLLPIRRRLLYHACCCNGHYYQLQCTTNSILSGQCAWNDLLDKAIDESSPLCSRGSIRWLFFVGHSRFAGKEPYKQWLLLLQLQLSLVLQYVAVCSSALQFVAVRSNTLQCVMTHHGASQCVAVRCSVLQCVAVCCSALQCVAVCCSVNSACCSTYPSRAKELAGLSLFDFSSSSTAFGFCSRDQISNHKDAIRS